MHTCIHTCIYTYIYVDIENRSPIISMNSDMQSTLYFCSQMVSG